MKPLQGFLQGLLPHRIRGWAFDPNDPDQHLTVEVRVDGVVIARAVASQLFPDLQQKQIGRGDHGFLIALDPPLPMNDGNLPEIVALSSGGQQRVLCLPKAVIAKPESNLPAGPKRKSLLERNSAIHTASSSDGVHPKASHVSKVGVGQSLYSQVSDLDSYPVFILGAARSGTSAMVRALMRTEKYETFNEGHLLPLVMRLNHMVQNYYAKSARDAAAGMKTLIANVHEKSIHDVIHAGFISIMQKTFSSGYWLDKTPGAEMIRAAPLMHRLWPNAKFIFMRRHPVDNIESRRRKFMSMDFTEHCRLWSDSMMTWYAIRQSLAECAMEVDQLTMATQPFPLAEQLSVFLNLQEEEKNKLKDAMSSVRPQTTGSDPAHHVSLADVNWSDQERIIFSSLCTEPARLFGY